MGAEIWPLLLALLVVVALGIALLRSNRTLLAARKENLRLLGELDLHHQAFDLLQEGLLLIAPDSSLLYANPAAVALAGAGRAPVPGESLSLGDFLPPPLSSAVGYGDPEETTRRIVELGEGEEGRVLELTGGPDGRGGRVLLLRDLRGPAAVDRKRRDFVANASHELQTPIAALIGLLDLCEEADPELRRELLKRARRNAQGLASLTRGLLGLARAEDPAWRPTPREQRVVEVFARVRERLGGRLPEGLLQEHCVPDLRVLVDPTALETVLANLVDNALAYAPGSTVELRAAAGVEGGVSIEVEDHGPGIAPEILPRIFERFFRGDPARSREGGGTGLGLAIVRNLVGRMGGRIAVRSRPGEGTLFRVELPASPGRPLPGAGQASFS